MQNYSVIRLFLLLIYLQLKHSCGQLYFSRLSYQTNPENVGGRREKGNYTNLIFSELLEKLFNIIFSIINHWRIHLLGGPRIISCQPSNSPIIGCVLLRVYHILVALCCLNIVALLYESGCSWLCCPWKEGELDTLPSHH